MLIEKLISKIKGKRVLITGGTTGIGRQIAIEMAGLGARVLVVGQDAHHLADTLSDIKQNAPGNAANGLLADLSIPEGIAEVFQEADSLFNGRLDVFINNAAIAYNSVLDGSYPQWKQAIDTNLLACIGCTRESLQRMLPQKTGHIILIGSMSAHVRERGSSVYVATKSGIHGFAECLRKEVSEQGINVTLIEPGATDTDMQPAATQEKKAAVSNQEMLDTADVAAAVVYALTQNERCDVVEIRLRPKLQSI